MISLDDKEMLLDIVSDTKVFVSKRVPLENYTEEQKSDLIAIGNLRNYLYDTALENIDMDSILKQCNQLKEKYKSMPIDL
jgi:hypothetical protein